MVYSYNEIIHNNEKELIIAKQNIMDKSHRNNPQWKEARYKRQWSDISDCILYENQNS